MNPGTADSPELKALSGDGTLGIVVDLEDGSANKSLEATVLDVSIAGILEIDVAEEDGRGVA